MAIHFNPGGYNRWAHLGDILGQGIGMGTSAYLGHKKQERMLAERIKALEPLVGPEKAAAYAHLDPATLNHVLKNEEGSRQTQALSNLSSQLTNYGRGQSAGGMQNLAPEGNVVGQISDTLDRPGAQVEQPASLTEVLMGLDRANINPQHYKELFNEAATIDKLRQAERKTQAVEEGPRRKEVEKRVAALEQKTEKSGRRIADYEMIDQLARSGQLNSGNIKRLADSLNIPFQGSATDVAQKLMANLNFERILGSVPGGKVTARLLDELAKTNPSLVNSNKSISVLSQLMINQEKEDMLLNDEVQRLIDKNKGKTPLDVMKQAQKNIKGDIDKVHEQSKELIDISYNLKPAKKAEQKQAASLKDFSSGDIVQDEDTGEYLVIQSSGKSRKATAAELKSAGVK